MNLKFFKHKMKEVKSFLRSVKGKVAADIAERVKGAKEHALAKSRNGKGQNRDISAI